VQSEAFPGKAFKFIPGNRLPNIFLCNCKPQPGMAYIVPYRQDRKKRVGLA
jgi:hypothetical protein